ncbi:alpha/beta fold hydrolase, partial [Kitasatospora sp. NPDC056808]
GWLGGIYAALSADTMPGPDEPDPHFVTRGGTMRGRFPAGRRPAWLTEADLDFYAGEFERTGLTGALNRYRNMDRDWEDFAAYEGAPLTQPTLFLGGALDASTTWLSAAIDAYPRTLPGLVASHLLDGSGHWLQQERPAEVNHSDSRTRLLRGGPLPERAPAPVEVGERRRLPHAVGLVEIGAGGHDRVDPVEHL